MARNRGREKRGRKLKLDENMMARIAGQIKCGNHIKTACVACGIGQTTFYDWKAQGEEDAAAGKRTKYATFLEVINHADAVAQQRLVNRVLKLGGWKGAMEILKRRWPKEYGDKTALSNADGTPLTPGGPAVNLTIKCDAPEDDDPWLPDPNAPADPADDEEPTDAPTP